MTTDNPISQPAGPVAQPADWANLNNRDPLIRNAALTRYESALQAAAGVQPAAQAPAVLEQPRAVALDKPPTQTQATADAQIAALLKDAAFLARYQHRDPAIRQSAIAEMEGLQRVKAGELPAVVNAAPDSPLDAALKPVSVDEYNFRADSPLDQPALSAFKQQLMVEGVHAPTASKIWADAPRVERISDGEYDAAVSEAGRIVAATPGGAQIIKDALAYFDKLARKGDAFERGVTIAMANPAAIIEASRLYRKGAAR